MTVNDADDALLLLAYQAVTKQMTKASEMPSSPIKANFGTLANFPTCAARRSTEV